MSENAIEVNDLEKRFGDFTAVDHVNFSVRSGEIFGFLGANGAGKSTTIRMLCGLLTSTSGTATVAGYDINREPEKVKTHIGYMSQRFSLYDDLTVRENISFFGGAYDLSSSEIDSRLEWIADMADLRGLEDKMTGSLPGGIKQRLALGCAVLHDPDIIFLDEPTSGVDPISRRNFWELINQLSENGKTVFVTTHYLDEAEYCNTIMLMHAGRVIAGGSPGKLKREHIDHPLIELSCDQPMRAAGILKGCREVIEISVFGNYLHIIVEDDISIERITEFLKKEHITVIKAESIFPTLEDVFIHLIERESSSARQAVE